MSAGGRHVLSLVAEEHGRVAALGQSQPRETSWHIARLMTNGNLEAERQTQVLAEMLQELSRAVAERGALRLHARVERRSNANEAFSRAGFSAYSHESVFWLPQPQIRSGSDDVPIRPQEDKDSWAIYQLYCAVTPWIVQQAEGIDSRYWDRSVASARQATQRMNEHRWVLDVGGEVAGYMCLTRLGRRLSLLVHPQAYRYARQMIERAVAEARTRSQVRCCLPEYQGELHQALEEAGFEYVATQIVYVKQLAAAVRAENRVLRPVMESSLEPARTVGHQQI
jgi:hypothetical protein